MLSKIGFIGVGIMGQGMLRNLLAKLPAETQFYIWSRKWETCKQFSEEFGDRVSSSRNQQLYYSPCRRFLTHSLATDRALRQRSRSRAQ